MKNRWFPLFQNISGRLVIIAGGGKIALRRVQSLLQFDCRICIIAPELCDELAKLACKNQQTIHIEKRPFQAGDIQHIKEQPFAVVAATSCREINHTIAEECAVKEIPVSVADCKEESSFYFPALIIEGPLIAGLSSGGQNHHAVRKTAEKIRAVLQQEGKP